MRVLKINDSKVKIMLTGRDMIAFGLDGAQMNMCEGDTRTKIYRVLDEVKAKHGFDHGGAKLVVQIYPMSDGGAEIFVTKISDKAGKLASLRQDTADFGIISSAEYLYYFDTYAELLHAVRALCATAAVTQSSLYSLSGGFVLLLTARGGASGGELCELMPLAEYGEALMPTLAPYVREHGNVLIPENAVSQLREGE